MKAPTPQDHMDIHTTLILLNKAGHDLGDLTGTMNESTLTQDHMDIHTTKNWENWDKLLKVDIL